MRAAAKTFIGTGILAATVTAGSAFATTPGQIETIDVCVGQAEVLRAPAGHAFTYTAPTFDVGYPSMISELEAMMAKGSQASDAEGTPAWFELRPNAELIQNDGDKMMHAPDQYMDAIRESKRSRFVIQARSEGVTNVSFFETNLATGEIAGRELIVNAKDCGASTRVVPVEANYLCEGEVVFPEGGMKVVRGKDALYHYVGGVSGRQMMAAVKSSRVVVGTLNEHGEYEYSKTKIQSEGTAGCGFADEARLEALEGENTYSIELCEGETWMMPFQRGAKAVTAVGPAAAAELDARRTGVSIDGVLTGFGMVTVEFNHGDAAPMEIYVETVSCN
jgi:hypothetical protein